jgi:hypothetical protein
MHRGGRWARLRSGLCSQGLLAMRLKRSKNLERVKEKDPMISWIIVVSSCWYPEEVGINQRASACASSLSVLLFSRQKAFWLTYLLDSLVDLLARLGHRMLT